jgi:hypothetical protein
MKQLTAAIGIVLATLMIVSSPARAAKSYNLSLRGVEVSGGARGTLTLVGRMSGSLPGSFEMTIRYNPATNAITGGTWKLTVAQQGRGRRASVAQGALAGSIEGGVVKLDKHGKANSVEGVRLKIKRGAGDYASVAGGAGEFGGTLNLRRPHPFAGELRISF